MTDFDFSQVTQTIKAVDAQGVQAALKRALTEESLNVGTVEIIAQYDDQKDILLYTYNLQITETGFGLGYIAAGVTTQNELVEGGIVMIAPNNTIYVGVELLTGLASRYEGQTLTVNVVAQVYDAQNKEAGSLSAQANIVIS